MEAPNAKVYVRVSVVFDDLGRMLPRSLVWEDGTQYREYPAEEGQVFGIVGFVFHDPKAV